MKFLNKRIMQLRHKGTKIKFFYKILLASLTLLHLSLFSFSQDYFKIEGSQEIIRFFPNLKENKEAVNDSTFIIIQKKKNDYQIKKIVNGCEIKNCTYTYNGKIDSKNLRERVLSKKGTKIVKKKIAVKILVPVSQECKIEYS